MNSFRAALNGEEHDITPVWFMRQAGRYLPGYTKLRMNHSIKQMCASAEMTEEITREPLDRLGVDAAIIFSDITVPLEAMGFELHFQEGIGPIIKNSLQQNPELKGISEWDPAEYRYATYEAMRKLKAELPETPLIGFVGGPLTIMSYLSAGKPDRDLAATKKLLFREEESFRSLMRMVLEMIIVHAKEQVKNGADVVQIFDSWAGYLSPSQFSDYSRRFLAEIVAELSPKTKLIYFSTQTGGIIEQLGDVGFDFLSVDWRIDLASASRRIRDSVGLQGNLDPALVAASPEKAVAEAGRIRDSMKNKTNYIFNLGHGVLQDTDPEALKQIVKLVHNDRVK